MGMLCPERILSAGATLEGSVEWLRSAAILQFCSHINKIDVRPRWKRKRGESSLQPKRTWELNNADGHYRRRCWNCYLYRGELFSLTSKDVLKGKDCSILDTYMFKVYLIPITTQLYLTGPRYYIRHRWAICPFEMVIRRVRLRGAFAAMRRCRGLHEYLPVNSVLPVLLPPVR